MLPTKPMRMTREGNHIDSVRLSHKLPFLEQGVLLASLGAGELQERTKNQEWPLREKGGSVQLAFPMGTATRRL